MESSSSSKVTVQYHDPAGVFPLISKQLQARLPLRNLNWQSPSRPLRRIKSLQVALVPEPTSSISGSSTKETENNDEVNDSRRHQIPGFKTSTYLKLYILRCDDKEQYKENSKAAIRNWVKQVTDTKQRSGHDAFEWLILHVVLPNTAAAGEPRWREGSAKEVDEPRERPKSSSKWPTKGSRTVFDRLRSDFNESKSAPDRVAQIRLTKDDVSADLLPPQAGGVQSWEESAAERENAWHDFITKLKALILSPFDARVRQYEADIAVQENRRSLPGWNFCTFFVQKEGLARALETIGLVEDALAVYDELALGLETVIEDIASGAARETATSFAETTSNMRKRLLGSGSVDLSDAEYRRRIVNSNISVFDFFCYIFARQKTLLKRLANVERSDAGGGGEDLVLLGEICWRASTYIHNNSRMLRQDLRRQDDAASEAMVQSWIYAMSDGILTDTKIPIFEQLVKTVDDDSSTSATVPGRQVPQRASSVVVRPRRPDTSGQLEEALPGQAELAAYRAGLIMIKRRAIESIAIENGWVIVWDIDAVSKPNASSAASLLSDMLDNEASFHQEYETLSKQAIRHYTLATQFRLVLSTKTDLARLYWQKGDYANAVENLAEIISAEPRRPVPKAVFIAYIRCLQQLERKREYAQAVVNFAATACREGDEDGQASRLLIELIRSDELDVDVQRPMQDYFADIEVSSEVVHHEGGCGFSMKLSLRSLLRDSLPADQLSVSLLAVNNGRDVIVLVCENSPTVVKAGVTEFLVSADIVSAGAYYIDQVRLEAGRLKLLHHFVPPPEVPTLIIGDAADHLEKAADQQLRPWLFLYPHEEDMDITLDLGSKIDVSKPRCLELALHGGKNHIEQLDIKLRPQSAGVRLHIGDAEVEGIKVRDLSQLHFGELKARTTASVRIPYTMENSSPTGHISVRCEALCKTTVGTFTFLTTQKMVADMPLFIDVEDSFQADRVISNFSIRTTDDSPVVIEQAFLEESSVYEIEGPPVSPLPALIANRQHNTSLIYRITRKQAELPANAKECSLSLRIAYRKVEDMVKESVSRQFLSDVASSPFHHLTRLLLPHLIASVKRSYGALELTRAAMLQQCAVPSYEEVEWTDITSKEDILSWLLQWHTSHNHIPLGPYMAIERRMTTAVDVPRPDFVHSVTMRPAAGLQAMQLGQPGDVALEVSSTTVWGRAQQTELDFLVDIHAQPDIWLVGGTKKARFTYDSTQTQRFEVSLVPLQVGLHALPSVDVQPVSAMEDGSNPVSSMSHCATAGETVQVVKDSQQTRVHIAGDSAVHGSHAVPLRA